MNSFIFLVDAEALWAPRGTVACLEDKNMNSFIFLVEAEALWAPRGTVACLKGKSGRQSSLGGIRNASSVMMRKPV